MSAYLERVKNRLPGGGDSKPASSSSSSGSGSISGLGIRNHVKSFASGGSDNSHLGASSNRAAQPLSSLRDPASFGPPPRHVGRRIQPPPDTHTQQQSSSQSQLALPAPPSQRYEDLSNTHHDSTPSPPLPARRDSSAADTYTNNRPPPPPRGGAASAPSLPPRLPPRTNSASPTLPPRPSSQAEAAPSKYGLTSNLNQGAINRLGAAGISVPAFGIGNSSNNNQEAPAPPPSRGSGGGGASSAQLNELQSRFSRLGTSNTTTSTSTNETPASTGTTWAQKQAALKTAAALRQDPSSVSFSDAKAAASTMNNFRQRHGEQVAAGLQGASDLQQKYGGSMLNSAGDGAGEGRAPSPAASVVATLAAKKKPPPPPPPKKPSSMSQQRPATSGNGGPAPPPVPLSTRPQF
ncbi:hypothetical protein B0T19DRAFT_104013 [Cercophora scortea]|uniref:Uncharacterized protein n=1 Tax=Cercophora scortea TaxID=314031 RepID=A0AAE0MIN0_9PEZI|nr:hypothetical protein B0T19DRAFT_104013 [Cercophora scortea]